MILIIILFSYYHIFSKYTASNNNNIQDTQLLADAQQNWFRIRFALLSSQILVCFQFVAITICSKSVVSLSIKSVLFSTKLTAICVKSENCLCKHILACWHIPIQSSIPKANWNAALVHPIHTIQHSG